MTLMMANTMMVTYLTCKVIRSCLLVLRAMLVFPNDTERL